MKKNLNVIVDEKIMEKLHRVTKEFGIRIDFIVPKILEKGLNELLKKKEEKIG